MQSRLKLVQLTHVINPSRFYCRDLSKSEVEKAQIYEIEAELQLVAEKQRESQDLLPEIHTYKKNDRVAFFSSFEEKWIRCEVHHSLTLNNDEVLVLWTTDYGTQLLTKATSNIVPLPIEHPFPPSMIFAASLAVMPSTREFDIINSKMFMTSSTKWGDPAVRFMKKKAHDDSYDIYFDQSLKESHPDVIVGDLLFKRESFFAFGLSSKLIEMDLAISVRKNLFQEKYNRLETKKIERWNDNSLTGEVLRQSRLAEEDAYWLTDNDETSFLMKRSKEVVEEWQKRNELLSEAGLEVELQESNSTDSIISKMSHFLSSELLEADKNDAGAQEIDPPEVVNVPLAWSKKKLLSVHQEPTYLPAGAPLPMQRKSAKKMEDEVTASGLINDEPSKLTPSAVSNLLQNLSLRNYEKFEHSEDET